MKTNRNLARAAIALLLLTIGSIIPAVAQGPKALARPAKTAVQEAQEPERVVRPGCCLQAATGQQGWTLVSAPAGVLAPHAAVTVTPPNPAWATALSGSAWVGPTAASGTANMPGGLYVYEYKFCLCREEQGQHPVLSLSFFSDNGSTVSLNAGFLLSPFTPANNSFQHPSGPFSVVYSGPVGPNDPKFKPCPQVNTLTITVDNQEGSDRRGTPTGLDAILNISGATAAINGECQCRE